MGGSRKTVAAGVAFVQRGAGGGERRCTRETVPASELTVALQCGGSDGYSGVIRQSGAGRRERSAGAPRRHGHPVGDAGDLWRRASADAPRGVSREVGEKLVGLMRWWEEYTAREGAEMNANPSPGNKAGGLTTILEKSLGAMAKARQHQPGRRGAIRRGR